MLHAPTGCVDEGTLIGITVPRSGDEGAREEMQIVEPGAWIWPSEIWLMGWMQRFPSALVLLIRESWWEVRGCWEVGVETVKIVVSDLSTSTDELDSSLGSCWVLKDLV